MNVLSKFSAKVTLVNKQQVSSYLQLGYNKCDNLYCAFKNSLQPVEGRYNCLGPVVTSANLSGFKLLVPSVDPRSSGSTTASDEDPSLQYCTGTYVVTTEQAHHVSHLFCVVQTDHCKRVKRDKAAKKAARDARYRAEKLAQEVHKDLDSEYALRRVEGKERAKKDELENKRNGGKTCDRKPQNPNDFTPVKRLRKEERRLPIIIRTGPPPTAVAEGSDATVDDDGNIPRSSSPLPLSPSTQHNLGHHVSSKPTAPPLFLRRRVRSGDAPRPSGIVWEDSVPALSGRSQSMRRAQYPPISSTRGRSKSGSIDTVIGRSQTSVHDPNPWVSSKNGVTITHFSTLLPAARCLSGRSDKENPVVSSSGKQYLISKPKPKRN